MSDTVAVPSAVSAWTVTVPALGAESVMTNWDGVVPELPSITGVASATDTLTTPPVIVKSALETSKKGLVAHSTLTRAVVVLTFGAVTASVPSLGVPEARVIGKLLPPSVESNKFIVAQLTGGRSVDATFQPTVSVAPPVQVIAVSGSVTLSGPAAEVTLTTIRSTGHASGSGVVVADGGAELHGPCRDGHRLADGRERRRVVVVQDELELREGPGGLHDRQERAEDGPRSVVGVGRRGRPDIELLPVVREHVAV